MVSVSICRFRPAYPRIQHAIRYAATHRAPPKWAPHPHLLPAVMREKGTVGRLSAFWFPRSLCEEGCRTACALSLPAWRRGSTRATCAASLPLPVWKKRIAKGDEGACPHARHSL